MTEKHSGERKVPKIGASAEDINQFLSRVIDYESSHRREIEMDWLRSKAYLEGHQWLTRVSSTDARRSPRVVRMEGNGSVSGKKGIPMPVTNEIMPPADNEKARLSKRNSEMYVAATDISDPASRAAAKVAEEVADHHAEEMSWHRQRRRHVDQVVDYGTSFMRSFHRLDNMETVKIGLPKGALRCTNPGQPGMESKPVMDEMGQSMMGPDGQPMMTPEVPAQGPCGFRLADKKAEPSPGLEMHVLSGSVRRKPTFDFEKKEAGADFLVEKCLECGHPLQEYVPSMEEAQETDFFGRPLGKDTPLGTAWVEVDSPFEAFPENEGLGITPEDMTEYAWCKIRNVDHVKRFQQNNLDKIVPEDPILLAEHFPITGEYGPDSKGARAASNRAIYHNHVRERGFIKDRCPDWPMGRYIVMAGNVVVVDDVLYVDDPQDPSKPIPRVTVKVTRCFRKDGEIWGLGFPWFVMSLQNRLNMTTSQLVDQREHAVVGILASKGMNLVRDWVNTFAGYVFRYEPDPANPDKQPTPFQTGRVDPSAWREIEHIIESIPRILGSREVETGGAPPGVTAYSALALVAEKASERRQPREKELIETYEAIWRHQLLLMRRFYKEPRKYRAKAGSGWQQKEFMGADLGGECGIKIKEEPQYDQKTASREALATALEKGTFQADTPYKQREVAKILGFSEKLLEEQNVQLEAADRKWMTFLRTGEVPVIDQNLDDHNIHYKEYGRLFLASEGVEYAEKAGWSAVLKVLPANKWKAILDAVIGVQLQAQAQGQGIFDWAVKSADTQNQQAQQQYQMMVNQPPMPDPATGEIPPPPQAPVPVDPASLLGPLVPQDMGEPPETLEDLILWVWQSMMAKNPPEPAPDEKARELFLRFRAVFEAHHIHAENLKMKAQQGQAQVAAPGSQPGQAAA